MELRVSLDEREVPDEEEEIMPGGSPSAMRNDVIGFPGEMHTIVADKHGMSSIGSADPSNPVGNGHIGALDILP